MQCAALWKLTSPSRSGWTTLYFLHCILHLVRGCINLHTSARHCNSSQFTLDASHWTLYLCHTSHYYFSHICTLVQILNTCASIARIANLRKYWTHVQVLQVLQILLTCGTHFTHFNFFHQTLTATALLWCALKKTKIYNQSSWRGLLGKRSEQKCRFRNISSKRTTTILKLQPVPHHHLHHHYHHFHHVQASSKTKSMSSQYKKKHWAANSQNHNQ